MRIAGVMSGTSLDGIDVAVIDYPPVRTIGFLSTPYPAAVRAAILAVSNTTTTTAAISRLNFELAELYARAVARAVRRFGPVSLIGCHGQTVYHEGRSNTLQLGEPAVLAERTGVPVVSNFRARDIAAGGEGAPLVPFMDALLFRHPQRTRVSLNIGGIANITVVPPRGKVVAFDTGPGNMVIDALAREYTKGRLHYDRAGRIAASGTVNRKLLDRLMRDPYYRRRPPKSAGREQYGVEFIALLRETGLPLPDLIATATAFTAATIAAGIRLLKVEQGDLIVAGGGTHNRWLMAHLAALLPMFAISTTSDHGIDVDAKEAIAFAILAHETWRRKPSNLPSATGAKRAVVLGSITP